VLERDGNRCQYCGKFTNRPHIDHVKPRSKGGKDTLSNLRVACPACNLRKSDQLVPGIRTTTKVRRYRKQRKREIRAQQPFPIRWARQLTSLTIKLVLCAMVVLAIAAMR
jgi:5-methylcytosine-specific restriction endonuclease McrA